MTRAMVAQAPIFSSAGRQQTIFAEPTGSTGGAGPERTRHRPSAGQLHRLDWSQIDPSILGTLFERGLDPGKRAQLGVHYTAATRSC